MHAGTRLQEALIDLEFHMRDEGLWQQEPPSDWAFASELPFFHDRMSFPSGCSLSLSLTFRGWRWTNLLGQKTVPLRQWLTITLVPNNSRQRD